MGNVEIPDWLKRLPLAPEFRPTDTEFADPVAYISKIEKEASAFGICKIIPPLPKPSKRYVFYNLNKSLMKCPELGSDINSSGVCNSLKMNSGDSGSDVKVRAVFTTRQQELGQSIKKTKEGVQSPPSGVHKQVWQSGEIYTLDQFESKSKAYARSVLGMVKEVSPLVIEAMFWKAASAKPIYVEYANDVPGSAFGELKGQSHYIHKRRRRKGYYKRSLGSSNCKKTEMDSIRDSYTDENKDTCTQNQADTWLQTSESTATLSTLSSNEGSHSSWQENSNAGNEMEGTAGWKLSNSPWNLQVIARSPGSLTRFMPDDIPGVTSPMIYIGMLFSWFAWHVEDHELHSLNFLHTGAPKTWYAVPGDYAFTFEEVIRSEVYGGNIDHLATLTLLGEKTTLLSPEVVVMSGIPCCRLIQNPGEFVVTFPRAYHVGFSHGFNCGEAANFGTPQWLTVAKEAAVRRAAMNYLPMLSHQQLLYLLTMSFIARVPRSLLPGVRSSRLKDRQKEERELLVKKAFIEDVLHENNLLSVLLEKGTTHHAVLWNADLLPDPSKHSQMPDLTSTSGTSVVEMSNSSSADKSSHGYLFDKMSLSIENLTDLSLGDDDLPCHFQTDSGALACVGCGILGFPFMAVIQPSERSLMELLPVNHHVLKNSSQNHNFSLQASVSGNLLAVSDLPSEKDLSKPSLKFDRVWNSSSKFLRPRIFCLEHALQIVEMLQGKGGVKLLVICHSDYQKIKAHARAVAEEIGSAFDYNEVPLDIASQEDLTLIDLAIDGEELDACEEDWTSKLGINLHYCIKARKNLPSKQVPCALALGMLFSDKGHSSESFSIKWQSRRCRSKRLKHLCKAKACDGTRTKKDDQSERRIELVSGSIAKNEILFQYSRRRFKSKQGCSSGRSMSHESQEKSKIVSIVLSLDHNNQVSEKDFDTENCRSDCVFSCLPTSTGTKMQHENQTSDVATSMNLNMAASQLPNSIPNPMLMYGGAGTEIENQTMEEREIDGKTSLTASNLSKMHYKISASEICSSEENQISYERKHSCSITVVTSEKYETLRKNQTTDVSKCDCMDLDDNKHEELQSSHKTNREEAASSTVSLVNQPALASEEKCSGSPKKNYGAETNSKAMFLKETTELEIITLNRSNEELIPHHDKPINKHTSNDENFEVPADLSAVDLYDPLPLDAEVQEGVQIGKGDNREINLSPHLLVKERCEYPRGEQAEGLSDVTLDSEKQHQDQNRNKNSEEPAPSNVLKGETESITVSEVICSQLSQEACPKGESSTQFISYRRRDREIQPKSINDEVCSVTETSQMESSVSVQECSTIEKEACYIEKNGTEVHLSQDNREWEGSELTMPASRSDAWKKRKREVNRITKYNFSCYGFARSPCEGLRPRAGKVVTGKSTVDNSNTVKETLETKMARKRPDVLVSQKNKNTDVKNKKSHMCDIDGCGMSFTTKAELQLHKRNRCPHEGCGKKFSWHKYALIHQRVHEDERPFKCPWKGCSMSFKWAWARTEHIRVHTGEKPYQCKVEGCGLSFRFVSDYSRHRRKMRHYV